MEMQYVLVSTFRNADGTFSVGGTFGPFQSGEDAEIEKRVMNFPSPEWVYVRPLHTGKDF